MVDALRFSLGYRGVKVDVETERPDESLER